MKRILLVLALILPLPGCVTFDDLAAGISLSTKSIANPVTPADEAQVEIALGGAITLLQAYKTACVEGHADVNCRANIAQIQPYTRQIPPLIIRLRTFVDSNDQINAAVVFNTLKNLYVDVKSTAAQLGINLGSSTL